ncbi:MAG: citrate/2-methylcitrate synthase [Desertimonas sp.]
MSPLIDVPPGLNGVAVTATTIGDVLGDEGRFHYRGLDAPELARRHSFDEVWHLVSVGHLPSPRELAAFQQHTAAARRMPPSLTPILEPMAQAQAQAQAQGATLGRVRAALSIAASDLGLRPLIDLEPDARTAQADAVAAVMPVLIAGLHRASLGLAPVRPDDDLGHAGAYLQMVTGDRPNDDAVRALERYLVLTIDHGFNASTFTARVVASTGADLADVVGAALGALAGPLHGGAPSRALDALDAIGDPADTEAWVTAELAAGRRIMGFGHAVYRTRDPRSDLLREVAIGLGGDLVERAVEVERRVLATLSRLKPDRPLPSNVEFFAGVVMAAAGLPRSMFTPTFAVSRTIGWVTHALEQAGEGKLIRPASRFIGPTPALP